MFSLTNDLELRKVTVSSLISCIYLPSIVTVISYKGVLYSVGTRSSFYILVLIFIAELVKSIYLSSNNETQGKRWRGPKWKTRDVMMAFGFLLLVTYGFAFGIALFGGPILDQHEETFMLSMLLTLLTVFPLVAHAGIATAMQFLFGVKTFSKDTIAAMLVNNALLTVGGAWLGAVVIPLDWNTPWQQWPIPCYLGAIGGYVLSNVMTVLKVTMMSAAHKYKFLNFFINIMNKLHISK